MSTAEKLNRLGLSHLKDNPEELKKALAEKAKPNRKVEVALEEIKQPWNEESCPEVATRRNRQQQVEGPNEATSLQEWLSSPPPGGMLKVTLPDHSEAAVTESAAPSEYSSVNKTTATSPCDCAFTTHKDLSKIHINAGVEDGLLKLHNDYLDKAQAALDKGDEATTLKWIKRADSLGDQIDRKTSGPVITTWSVSEEPQSTFVNDVESEKVLTSLSRSGHFMEEYAIQCARWLENRVRQAEANDPKLCTLKNRINELSINIAQEDAAPDRMRQLEESVQKLLVHVSNKTKHRVKNDNLKSMTKEEHDTKFKELGNKLREMLKPYKKV